MEDILGFPMKFNVYDIREKCMHPPLCYDLSDVDGLMKDAKI